MMMHLKELFILCFSEILLLSIAGLATGNAVSRGRAARVLSKNRDGSLSSFPDNQDSLTLSSHIVEAHDLLSKGLQDFLDFKDADLGTYLNHLISQRTEPFIDEYGQVIRLYKKVFRFIWEQYNETLVRNYAIGQFDKDKLNLCSVARFLSHQPTVQQRETIMKQMGDALRYRCHPCTPYTPKQYDETIVPSTDGINPEGISPEESLILCKGNQSNDGKGMLPPPGTSTPPRNVTMQSTNSTNVPFSDYFPCKLLNLGVVCDQVPLVEVKKVFSLNSPLRLQSVLLILQPFIFTETYIPEDILGNKRALEITLRYPFDVIQNSSTLQVDPNAFRSTQNYTRKVTLNYFDCNLLDLGFLSGFEKITDLIFVNLWNFEFCFSSLPPLSRLMKIDIGFCIGMNKLYNFPTLRKGLKAVSFFGTIESSLTSYNDESVDRIMDWLLLSSENTLEELSIIAMNQVTQVPPQISLFKTLKNLWLYNNSISTIKTGAFRFSVPVITLDIASNGIREIEPGAFQGNFKDADFIVLGNNLTELNEMVFGPVLQQMASGVGVVNFFDGNPIDCGIENICHLSWLNPYKSSSKFSLICSNGTSFQDLHSTGFNHCPQIIPKN